MRNKFLHQAFFALALLSFFAFVSDAGAQTKRRKRTTKTPVVSPTPQTTEPTVVSRNDEYLDSNQIIYGQNPQTETTNQTVEPNANVQPTENTVDAEARIKELTERIKSLESASKNQSDEKQKRLLLNLDILSRAETRAESLRKQLFEMIEKENGVQLRIEQINNDARPESIERSLAFVGSLRPEEIREQRRKSLEAEKRNLELLLTQIQTSRATLEENVQKADFLVEKVRLKLDKEIEDALAEEKP